MATYSTRLGLKMPEEGDPFLHTDFVSNYGKLDERPGVYPCTSTTRPKPGTAQKGMLIYETDTRRIMAWSGTAWQEPHTAAPTFQAEFDPEVTISGSQEVRYTLGSFNVKRPCRAVIWGTCIFRTSDNEKVEFFPYLTINNSFASVTSGAEWFSADYGFQTGPDRNRDHQRALLGTRNLNPGNHTFGFYGGLNNNSPNATSRVRIAQVKAVIMLANGTDT